MIYEVTPRQAFGYVEDCMYAGLIPFLKGKPGHGKSSGMAALTKRHNLKMLDHRVSTSAPEDFSGLPRFREDGRAEFAPFADLFPLEDDPVPEGYDGWNLFLDEMNSGTRMVQAAMYKLLLDRYTGQKKLNERLVITAAGNRDEDKAIVEKLSTAIKSRVVTLNLKFDFKEFMEDVMLPGKWDTRIMAFLSQNPEYADDFDPNMTTDNFCCPRTWENINKLINKPGSKPVDDSRTGLFAGTITAGKAVSFIQFCKLQSSLISVDQILSDPLGSPIPDSAEKQWLLVSQIINRINEQNFGKLCQYINRMRLSFQILFGRTAQVYHPKLRSHPEFAGFVIKIAEYLKPMN